jgi:hypothetical protein
VSRLPLLLTVPTAALVAGVVALSPAGAAPEPETYTFGVIGDVPYGADQVAAFPGWVDSINADDDVSFVTHVGDIKSGSMVCSDAYFDFIRTQFDRFDTPLVYTPGDNEWTDCHRTNNGGYDPYERLDAIRSTFFDRPGATLGAEPMKVDAQADFPENVDWRRARIRFMTAHAVGSNNGLAPWTGASEPNDRQVAEVQARTEANIAQLREAFAQARAAGDRGVVVFQQADMFDPTYDAQPEDYTAFRPWAQAIVDEASSFDGPVYLIDGDSHVHNVDRPLEPGSRWLEFYGVEGAAANLTRITVDGSSNNTDWLKVQVHQRGDDLLTWEQVPY